MSWLSTIGTAILTAAIGTVVSGYLANLSVSWYRVSSFEGGSGYYVVGLALCGLVAGLIIGLVTSRIVAGTAHPSMLMAMKYSVTLMLAVAGITGGTARLLADIPPTIDGESLMLHVEAQWPASRKESPARVPGVAYLDLLPATVLRQPASTQGALWKEDAHRVDGRWTVNGVVPIVTSRGTPKIDIALNAAERVSFTLPSLAHPTTSDSAWSAWSSHEAAGATTSGVTYRYRVLKISAPVRTEHIGNFAVSAVVSYFKGPANGGNTLDFYGTFRIAFRDQPLSALTTSAADHFVDVANVVAQLPGTEPALLVADGSNWELLTEEGSAAREQHLGKYTQSIPPAELTNSAERMAETREPRDPGGRVDTTTFARSKMLLFDGAVLNVETHAIHRFAARSTASVIPSVPLLGIAPDAQSFVRFVWGSVDSHGEYPPLLAVTDFIRDTVYEVPIDQVRMKYASLDDLNTEWLARYFVWKRDTNGIEKLEAR